MARRAPVGRVRGGGALNDKHMWVFPLSGPITGRQTASNRSRLDERRPGEMTRGNDTKGGWEKWQRVEEGGGEGRGGGGEGRRIMNYKCVTNEGSVEVGMALWTTPSINSSNKTGGSVAQQEDGGDSSAAAAAAARLSGQNIRHHHLRADESGVNDGEKNERQNVLYVGEKVQSRIRRCETLLRVIKVVRQNCVKQLVCSPQKGHIRTQSRRGFPRHCVS